MIQNTIEVDFEVFKTLTFMRKSETDSINDVLRRELKLKPLEKSSVTDNGRPWVTEGISFPHGTDFRMNRKGQFFFGTVMDGALVVDGKRFTHASRAAHHIVKGSVNGWKVWWCKRPTDSDFILIDQLRS